MAYFSPSNSPPGNVEVGVGEWEGCHTEEVQGTDVLMFGTEKTPMLSPPFSLWKGPVTWLDGSPALSFPGKALDACRSWGWG